MNSLDKEDLISLLQQNREKLKEFHIKQIGLFGSFSKGKQTEESDIDLLVEFQEGKKTYNNFIELLFFLEKIFQKKVDLLTIEALSSYMRSKIMKKAHFESI